MALIERLSGMLGMSGGGAAGRRLEADLERLLLAVGRAESERVRAKDVAQLREAEFRIFSQFGEDGIIQYLISRVPIERDTFVEIGVQDYRESNTRFLVWNNNWAGLIIDGGTAHVDFVRADPIGWRHSVTPVSRFVTRENVNDILWGSGASGDIGLLSLDIDGVDYWVLEAIEAVRPRILVVEYNSTFGPDAAVTIPYEPTFERMKAHPTGLYWGASLAAVCMAAERKGLAFVGSNSAGNNAFFVRADLVGGLPLVTAQDGWVDARFREARDAHGRLTYLDGRAARMEPIADLALVDVRSGARTTVGACP